MGILIFVFILAVMGFVLAWITGVVARVEMSTGKAMVVVFVNGIATGVAGLGLAEVGVPGLAGAGLLIVLSLGLMSLLLRAIGGVDFKKGVAIAVIFAVLTSLTQWGLSSCMQSAAESYTPPAR